MYRSRIQGQIDYNNKISKVHLNKVNREQNFVNKKLEKLAKWAKFKDERMKVIDKYVEMKRKGRSIKTILVNIKIRNLLTNLQVNLEHTRYIHKLSLSTCFIALKCIVKWKVMIRKYGHTKTIGFTSDEILRQKQKNQVRACFTLGATSRFDRVEQSLRKVFFSVMATKF